MNADPDMTKIFFLVGYFVSFCGRPGVYLHNITPILIVFVPCVLYSICDGKMIVVRSTLLRLVFRTWNT